MAVERRWSGTLTLGKVVSSGCLPTLVRLEEGYRGPRESLSLSSGDIMALQSCVTASRKKVVLTYYMEDNDIDDWNPDNTSEDYRKLIVLPLHNKCISRLEVCQLYDPDRDLYRRYVNSRFREWSWIDREDDLKQALEKSNCCDDISVYTDVNEVLRRRSTQEEVIQSPAPHPDSPKERKKTPPPPPPRRPSCREPMQTLPPPVLPPRVLPRGGNSMHLTESIYEISDEDFANSQPILGRSPRTDVTSVVPLSTNAPPIKPRTRTTRSQKDYLVPCYLPHQRVASPARVTPSPEYTDVDVVEMDKDRRKQAKARSPTSPTPLQPPRSPAQSRAHPGSKPVGRVQPSVIPISHPDQNKQPIIPPHPDVSSKPEQGLPEIKRDMTEMTIRQLCSVLDKCGMTRLAEVCQDQRLDGNYLSSLSDSSLSNDPFSLSLFELDKLRRIKLGWRPNLG
ncbi:uncharacterized protein LOC112557285 [Pomacea canaliculata]|uniref:uncharacterized protein LOC112557285 n=1 Tax=Pomacea canaliculata TaxID=400727 RepID=UPI000D738228|nr:uncharacterized protein LOC112557285 [Pomacea canaliculata]XP_025082830.1 uncharacterized protein LOC112557285 [Pomacea canaliculata]XP_025082831.1 uncharacterized protein LOC112557285 [Pomacea canaliculata]